MSEAVASVSLSPLDFGPKECKYRSFLAPNHAVKEISVLEDSLDSPFSLRSAEYLAQSGVMASLLKQQREETQGTGTSVSTTS